MREILFRGLCKDTGEWAEGLYSITGDGSTNIDIINSLGLYEDSFCVYPSTVGQYTGLTDKNGKRIFEGDICRGLDGCLWEVCFGEYGDCSDGMQVGFYYRRNIEGRYDEYFCMLCSTYHPETFTVIGNIHDNPELLDATHA